MEMTGLRPLVGLMSNLLLTGLAKISLAVGTNPQNLGSGLIFAFFRDLCINHHTF